jgi:hypothetical protein
MGMNSPERISNETRSPMNEHAKPTYHFFYHSYVSTLYINCPCNLCSLVCWIANGDDEG